MKPLACLNLRREVAVRVIADFLMINAATLLALIVCFLYQITSKGIVTNAQEHEHILLSYLKAYWGNAWLLTSICLLIFYASGFYTYGRRYTGRHKGLTIIQAVTSSFILFASLLYVFDGTLKPSLGAWVLAWLLTLCILIVSRVWSLLWRNVVRVERRLTVQPEKRDVRNVLVIGGAGYIGSAILPKLLEKGYKVRLLDLLLYGTEPIKNLMSHPHLEIIRGDFREVDKVVESMNDMDAVIHLGAIVGDPACALDENLTIEVNLMATRMIAEVARGTGVRRFIFASTCSVYGASLENALKDENSDLNPVSLYARSKIASEQVLMGMAGVNFAPTCLRFPTVYGLSGRTRFDLVVNLLTAKAVIDGVITVINGDQWRSFLHVDDAADAAIRVLQAPLDLVRNQIFNVGSDEQNHTIQQVGELIQRMVPTAQLTCILNPSTDQRNYRVGFRKIRSVLGFLPRRSIEQGVQQVIDTIRSGEVQSYGDSKYSNEKFLVGEGRSRIHCINGWANDLLKENSPTPAVWVRAADAPG